MKNTLIILVTGAILAAVCFVVGHRMSPGTQPPALANLQDAAWLKKQLDLTNDQVDALSALAEEYGAQLITLCERHCAARNQLAEQLLRRDWRKETEMALLEEMGRAQVQTDAVTLEHIRRVRQVLNPSQRVEYERDIIAHMNASCPHQLHHGALATAEPVH